MPFNPNIPLANDQLTQSQADIYNNFQALGGMLDLTAGATAIKFDRDVAVPPTAVTSVGVYAANSILAPGTTQLFFRNQNNGASYEMTTALAAANGWTSLPSGIIIQWGIANIFDGTVATPFPRAFPNNCWSVTLTPMSVGQINIVKLVAAPALATFNAKSNVQNTGASEAVNVYFIAIGN